MGNSTFVTFDTFVRFCMSVFRLSSRLTSSFCGLLQRRAMSYNVTILDGGLGTELEISGLSKYPGVRKLSLF